MDQHGSKVRADGILSAAEVTQEPQKFVSIGHLGILSCVDISSLSKVLGTPNAFTATPIYMYVSELSLQNSRASVEDIF